MVETNKESGDCEALQLEGHTTAQCTSDVLGWFGQICTTHAQETAIFCNLLIKILTPPLDSAMVRKL